MKNWARKLNFLILHSSFLIKRNAETLTACKQLSQADLCRPNLALHGVPAHV